MGLLKKIAADVASLAVVLAVAMVPVTVIVALARLLRWLVGTW